MAFNIIVAQTWIFNKNNFLSCKILLFLLWNTTMLVFLGRVPSYLRHCRQLLFLSLVFWWSPSRERESLLWGCLSSSSFVCISFSSNARNFCRFCIQVLMNILNPADICACKHASITSFVVQIIKIVSPKISNNQGSYL